MADLFGFSGDRHADPQAQPAPDATRLRDDANQAPRTADRQAPSTACETPRHGGKSACDWRPNPQAEEAARFKAAMVESLKHPLDCGPDGRYTARYGDTLETIARRELKFGNKPCGPRDVQAEMDRIVQANIKDHPTLGCNKDLVRQGWKLRICDEQDAPPPAPVEAPPPPPPVREAPPPPPPRYEAPPPVYEAPPPPPPLPRVYEGPPRVYEAPPPPVEIIRPREIHRAPENACGFHGPCDHGYRPYFPPYPHRRSEYFEPPLVRQPEPAMGYYNDQSYYDGGQTIVPGLSFNIGGLIAPPMFRHHRRGW